MKTQHLALAVALGLGLTLATLLALASVQTLVAWAASPLADDPIVGLTAVNDSPTQLGYTTTFTASVISGTNVLFTWVFGDSTPPVAGPTVTHIYSQVGVYHAGVTAINGTGIFVANTVVTVDVPMTSLNVVNDSPTLLGNVTLFTAQPGTAILPPPSNVVYDWDFGDGWFDHSTSLTETHLYSALGVYTAVITASNSLSRITTTSQVIIVDSPIATLTATNDGPTILGSLTTLSALVTGSVIPPPPSNVTYTWAFGDGATGAGAIVTHQYPAHGTFTAVVTAANSVSLLTATTEVQIVEAPLAGLSLTNDGPTQLGQSTRLVATAVVTVGTAILPAGSNVTYDWNFGDDSAPAQILTSPSGMGLGIPDNGCGLGNYLTSTINVTQTGLLVDVQVEIYDLRHTFDADLNIYLLGPDGTQIALSTGNGGTGSYYYQTIFSDRAATPITAGLPPFTGRFRPQEPLATFAGKSQQGDWSLCICDNSPTIVGALNKWGITLMSMQSASSTVTHTYPATGIYTATVTARNSFQSLAAYTSVKIVPPGFYVYLPIVIK